MADSGLVYPGSVAQFGPGDETAWINESNALSVSPAVAETGELLDVENANWIHFYNFNLGSLLPSGCTIDGIVVDHKASMEFGTMVGQLHQCQAIVSGSRTGSTLGYVNLTTTITTRSIGNSVEKWGISPTYSMVTASDFGFAFKYRNWTGADPGRIFLDYVRIRVYYTAASLVQGFYPML